MIEALKLIQFRAAYNLPVHAGIAAGIFAGHGLAIEIAYTPGSLFLSQALKDGRFDIGHTGADDVVADVESDSRSDLFIFMGLHGGLFSLIGAPKFPSVQSLFDQTIGVDAASSGFVLALENFLRAQGLAKNAYRLSEIGGWESRCRALLEGTVAATLLTEPFIDTALRAGCHLLARDFEIAPDYQGTCGAASRSWAMRNSQQLIRYLRAYSEATCWCFARENRNACLDLLTRHHEMDRATADLTLNALLDPAHGLYPKAAVNLSGVAAVVELRADLGYLPRPVPPLEKYVDLAYYRNAVERPGPL
jgi:ABC-type nitrate/sulfonate/bicarbonate transport system substrate-binding protein